MDGQKIMVGPRGTDLVGQDVVLSKPFQITQRLRQNPISFLLSVKMIIFILFFSFPCLSFGSENVIFGFLVQKDKISHLIGSKDQKIINGILNSQKKGVENLSHRFKYWSEYKKQVPLSVEDGLNHIFNNTMVEKYAFEYQCITELLFRGIGEELEDSTYNGYNGLLRTYMDFWLDGPIPVMEKLNLTTLAKKWATNNNPLPIKGDVDWPIVNSLSPDEINQAYTEFNAADIKSIFKMEKKYFEGRSDDLSENELKKIMHATIEALHKWIKKAYQVNQENKNAPVIMVLIFDGDS